MEEMALKLVAQEELTQEATQDIGVGAKNLPLCPHCGKNGTHKPDNWFA
jgi:hypothetical protein